MKREDIEVGSRYSVKNRYCSFPVNRKAAGSVAKVIGIDITEDVVYFTYIHGPHSDLAGEEQKWSCCVDDFIETYNKIETKDGENMRNEEIEDGS